jgi:hypothetical protein
VGSHATTTTNHEQRRQQGRVVWMGSRSRLDRYSLRDR